MKFIILFAALITLTLAAEPKKPIAEHFKDFAGEPNIDLIVNDDERPPTNYVGDVMKAKTNSINTLHGNGKFNFNFETENGISVASIGKLRDGKDGKKAFVVTGSYTYTGADGKRYRVRYTADEFGYHPVTELDDTPEKEIIPAKPIAPFVPASPSTLGKFASLTSFKTDINQNNKQQGFGNSGNGFNSGNNFFSSGQNANSGVSNGFNGRVNEFTSRNGVNTIDGFSKFDRTGKSLDETSFIFNENFVRAQTPNVDHSSRLYLPPQPYLPPKPYLPPF